jgi:hypothetical protein
MWRASPPIAFVTTTTVATKPDKGGSHCTLVTSIVGKDCWWVDAAALASLRVTHAQSGTPAVAAGVRNPDSWSVLAACCTAGKGRR